MSDDVRYKVTMTEDEANIILTSLGQLPYVQVFGLIEAIRAQIQGQMKQLKALEIPPKE